MNYRPIDLTELYIYAALRKHFKPQYKDKLEKNTYSSTVGKILAEIPMSQRIVRTVKVFPKCVLDLLSEEQSEEIDVIILNTLRKR